MKVENNNNKVNKQLVVGSTIAGAIGGGIYARNHMSEGRIKQIAELNLDGPEHYKKIADCFNCSKAQQELRKGNINQQEYNAFKEFHDKCLNASNKETEVKNIVSTEIKNRTKTYKEAVDKANQARLELIKTGLRFPKDVGQKLSRLNLINGQKLASLNQMQLEKVKKAYKIMAKPIGIGAACGIGLGYAFGMGLGRLIHTKKEQLTNKH